MLSILIPVYNFEVRELVSELYTQATDLHIPFEIRCYDDGSYFDYKVQNQRITALNRVYYRELPENIGRSKIRNRLAEDARYDTLLFLDCDGRCERQDFVSKYMQFTGKTGIVCGGRTYHPQPPTEADLMLHWTYGSSREVTTATERNKNVYRGFQTNNFLIDKQTFLSVKLDESLEGYGHEDTLFGLELERRKISVTHIDNPMRHTGLESSDVFLEKTREGVKNLAMLIRENKINKSVRLFKAYSMLKTFSLTGYYHWKLGQKEPDLLAACQSPAPDLKSFDKLKLLWLLRSLKG